MTAARSVKARLKRPLIVGVIASRTELRRAVSLRHPPDLFEVRLDHLIGLAKNLKATISKLPAPIIITARHPAEGGVHNLSPRQRIELLERFLENAAYVDAELRSVPRLASLLQQARRQKVKCILSFHHFGLTPQPRSLHARARLAKRQGADIFKVATRTDTPAQLASLIRFAATCDPRNLPVAIMGMGRLGAISRLLLAKMNSAFIYASIARSRVEGQMSVEQVRTALTILGIA